MQILRFNTPAVQDIICQAFDCYEQNFIDDLPHYGIDENADFLSWKSYPSTIAVLEPKVMQQFDGRSRISYLDKKGVRKYLSMSENNRKVLLAQLQVSTSPNIVLTEKDILLAHKISPILKAIKDNIHSVEFLKSLKLEIKVGAKLELVVDTTEDIRKQLCCTFDKDVMYAIYMAHAQHGCYPFNSEQREEILNNIQFGFDASYTDIKNSLEESLDDYGLNNLGQVYNTVKWRCENPIFKIGDDEYEAEFTHYGLNKLSQLK